MRAGKIPALILSLKKRMYMCCCIQLSSWRSLSKKIEQSADFQIILTAEKINFLNPYEGICKLQTTIQAITGYRPDLNWESFKKAGNMLMYRQLDPVRRTNKIYSDFDNFFLKNNNEKARFLIALVQKEHIDPKHFFESAIRNRNVLAFCRLLEIFDLSFADLEELHKQVAGLLSYFDAAIFRADSIDSDRKEAAILGDLCNTLERKLDAVKKENEDYKKYEFPPVTASWG